MPDTPRAGVVIIHGSGPDSAADYDHQAQVFAAMGIAALTYDKRGWAKSGGDWRNRPVNLLAADAIAGAAELRRRLGVPVGYWGISQGGWVLAKVGARDPNAAFLIGVAASGVTPFQQERWHKDRMMRAAGYPSWARRTADRYWSAALDLMIQLDRHRAFLPWLLQGERAGSSFGLAYDPAPDWAQTKAPLLLLYGMRDELQPWFDSGSRVGAARPPGTSTVIRNVEGASHAITRGKTGLEFDWGEHDDPGYAPMMARFVDTALASTPPKSQRPVPPPPWLRRPAMAAPLALAGLIFLPLLMLALLLRARTGLARWLAISGLASWAALVTLILFAIHPQGSFYDPAARFPTWGWVIPPVFLVTLFLSATVLLRVSRRTAQPTAGLAAAAVVAFLLYWA